MSDSWRTHRFRCRFQLELSLLIAYVFDISPSSILVATVAILGWALSAILRPLWTPLGWAVMLAFLLHPLHDRLTAKLKGRHSSSASILTLATPFIVITPSFSSLSPSTAGGEPGGRSQRTVLASVAGVVGPGGHLSGNRARCALVERLGSGQCRAGRGVDRKRCSSSTEIRSGGEQYVSAGSRRFGRRLFPDAVHVILVLRDGRTVLEYLRRLIPMEPPSKARLFATLGM